MANITPAQQKTVQTWVEKRDSMLLQVRNLTIQLDALEKSVKSQGLALADLHSSSAEARGRLAEVNALEERMRGSLSNDIAELQVRKFRLEGECAAIETKMRSVTEKHDTVVAATSALQVAHDTMKDQSAIVNRVVGEIIQTSQLHTSDMKTMMAQIKSVSDQVVDKGNENVKQTGIILEKLPKYIFELQKPIPLRRTFVAPRGAQIDPEK